MGGGRGMGTVFGQLLKPLPSRNTLCEEKNGMPHTSSYDVPVPDRKSEPLQPPPPLVIFPLFCAPEQKIYVLVITGTNL
jgi:hypothetical protein